MTPSRGTLAFCAVTCFVVGGQIRAQIPVSGRVVDQNDQPVADAVVSARSGGSTLTDQRGVFRLTLALGPTAIVAQRLGYLLDERRMEIVLATDTVLLRLRALPALLKGITVDAPFAPPLAQALTSQTVRQVPPLLEADVFRALVLLPGVAQPNDLRGRVHLGGGASDETGIRLDGHPLQDPFHLFGLLGAFNVAALEQATVQIHHVPLASSGNLSGVVDLETKAPGTLTNEATLSLLTAGTAVARDMPAGFDVLVAARSSYFKAFAQTVYSDAQLSRGNVPLYDARDALVRIGRGRGASRWEAIAFTTRDGMENGRLRGRAGYEPLGWGELLAGVRSMNAFGRWRLTTRASVNRADIHTDERVIGPNGDFVDLRRDLVTTAAVAERPAGKISLLGGVEIQRRRYRQSWRVSQANTDIFSPRTPNGYSGDSAAVRLALFSTSTARLGDRGSLTAGGLVHFSSGAAYVAPQLVGSYRVGAQTSIEMSLERRHQFDAELEESIEGTVGTPRFLLESPRVADVLGGALSWRPVSAAASTEFRGFMFAKVYRRAVHLKDTEIGTRVDIAPPSFPEFESVPALSRGIGLMAKAATVSGIALQGSYTYTGTSDQLDGTWSPRDGDVPHAAVAFAAVPVKWLGMDVTAAMQVHSGAAISPVAARVLVPDERTYRGIGPRYLPGDRNSFRLSPYRRLDLGGRRTWHRSSLDITLSAQVLNLLFRRNPRNVSWDLYYDYVARGFPDALEKATSGLPGLPILPSIGVEVRW
jgi:hypothetical protein